MTEEKSETSEPTREMTYDATAGVFRNTVRMTITPRGILQVFENLKDQRHALNEQIKSAEATLLKMGLQLKQMDEEIVRLGRHAEKARELLPPEPATPAS